jgi:hypothetical protein
MEAGVREGFRCIYPCWATADVRIGSKMRKPRNEHMSAGLPPITDIAGYPLTNPRQFDILQFGPG